MPSEDRSPTIHEMYSLLADMRREVELGRASDGLLAKISRLEELLAINAELSAIDERREGITLSAISHIQRAVELHRRADLVQSMWWRALVSCKAAKWLRVYEAIDKRSKELVETVERLEKVRLANRARGFTS